MPKLGDYRFILDNVVFIYRSAEQAIEGRKGGATGFFVAVPSERSPDDYQHIYVVTNVHVTRNEPRTLRLNTRDGKVDVITITNWVSVPKGPDVTVARVNLDPTRHVVEALRSDSWLLTKEDFTRLELDAGDDVFM